MPTSRGTPLTPPARDRRYSSRGARARSCRTPFSLFSGQAFGKGDTTVSRPRLTAEFADGGVRLVDQGGPQRLVELARRDQGVHLVDERTQRPDGRLRV